MASQGTTSNQIVGPSGSATGGQQQNQWNQYHQAIAAALVSGSLGDSLKSPLPLPPPQDPHQTLKSHQFATANTITNDNQSILRSQQNLLAHLISLISGNVHHNNLNLNNNNPPPPPTQTTTATTTTQSASPLGCHRFNPTRQTATTFSNVQPTIAPRLKSVTNQMAHTYHHAKQNDTTTTSNHRTACRNLQQQQQRQPSESPVSVINSTAYWRLLESLFAMNDKPEDDAIELIAQRINSTGAEVATWFKARREAERSLYNSLSSTMLMSSDDNVEDNDDDATAAAADNDVADVHHEDQQQYFDGNLLANCHGEDLTMTQKNSAKLQASNHHHHNHHHDQLNRIHGNQFQQQLLARQNNTTNNLLESFYAAQPFLTNMLHDTTTNKLPPFNIESPNSLTTPANSAYKAQPPAVPSSTLLAKLNAVTSRPNYHVLAAELDQRIIDLLEAFYAINDNPEPSAIEMIAKRINTTVEAIGDWFDEKRLKTNPHAGPRSPPAKKREGGRVVTFSEYQRSLLEAIFDENNYLHPQEYEELSNLIQVPSRNIKIWFKNRRSKQRLSGRIATP